jgi:uncharacterized integral membrane protein
MPEEELEKLKEEISNGAEMKRTYSILFVLSLIFIVLFLIDPFIEAGIPYITVVSANWPWAIWIFVGICVISAPLYFSSKRKLEQLKEEREQFNVTVEKS